MSVLVAETRRTVRIRLTVPSDAKDDLWDTLDQYRAAANRVVDEGWNDNSNLEARESELHDATYHPIKTSSDLHANHVTQARSAAAEALKACVERRRQGHNPGKPRFTSATVNYDQRCYTIQLQNKTVSLATTNGRIQAQLHLSNKPEGTPHGDYLLSEDYEPGGATLHHRDGDWWLHVVMKRETTDAETPQHPTVLGVDLGIENLATTSTAHFHTGGPLNHRREEYEKTRASLQQTGTQSAHCTLERLSSREARWNQHHLHVVSRRLVDHAAEQGVDVIAFEDLTNIRDQLQGGKRYHEWAFRQLVEYVEYKAQALGIQVEQVNPVNTSRTCSRCGHTSKENLEDRWFSCQACGYENDRDYNAAKSIGYKYLVSMDQKSSVGTGHGKLALTSGTMTPNECFSCDATHDASLEGENTGKARSEPAQARDG
jgi:IS605 OrfB family transposase